MVEPTTLTISCGIGQVMLSTRPRVPIGPSCGKKAILGAKKLWKVRTPNNCKFFIWLVLLGRCWTSKSLQRHGLLIEGIARFVHRSMRQELWSYDPGLAASLITFWIDWWLRVKKSILKPRRRMFDSLVVLITWTIWMECNARVF